MVWSISFRQYVYRGNLRENTNPCKYNPPLIAQMQLIIQDSFLYAL